jgi:glutamate-1-semialdehyde aminotransferase
VFPFAYNDIEALEELIRTHDIGVIKMEVSRNFEPTGDFLVRVRQLANEHNVILIFDECTSGFRQALGGLHKVYGVDPDMAVFGKALGNGYAVTGVIGKRDIMEAAQNTFISSTFWTERIGSVAGVATLAVMDRERSWEKITATGRDITARWQALGKKYDLPLVTAGVPALSSFSFKTPRGNAYKTLLSQEMLAKGYLAGNSVYACTEHTPEIVDGYFEALAPVFALIRECEDGRDVLGLLKGPIAHTGFTRLN